MKTILLTGATGFLGSHLLAALLKQGYQVTILKRSTSDTWRIEHLLDQVFSFDIDLVMLEQAFKARKIDVVIHTACSYGRNGQPSHEVLETNLLFSLRLLDAATYFNVGTFINTDTLLPKYLNAYVLSKKQFVEWLQQSSRKLQVINLKIEHMYGPRDDNAKFVSWLIGQLRENVKRIPLTAGKQLRDFIYVDDVVSAYLMLLTKTDQLSTFNDFDVGTGKLTAVRDFVEALHNEFMKYSPDNRTALGFGELPMREGELVSVEVNNSALIAQGWAPGYALNSGLAKTIDLEFYC